MAAKPGPTNTILFCKRPWKAPALALVVLILLTVGWAFVLLGTLSEEAGLHDDDDFSIASLLFHNIAMPDTPSLYDVIPPTVVGLSGGDANSDVVASGAIVAASGYVLTALHAVADLPTINVHVRTPSAIRRYEAEIVKSVSTHNLVLLKILTQDRFPFLTLGNSRTIRKGEWVFGFGHGPRGNLIFKPGQVLATNIALSSEAAPMPNLMATDAVYTWEQNGGPLTNVAGELVGMNVALANPSGRIEGYAVPAQVILSHFLDVVNFEMAQSAKTGVTGGTAAPEQALPRQAPPRQAESRMAPQGERPGLSRSAAWWAKARARVGKDNRGPLGVNVALGAVPPSPLGATAATLDEEHLPGLRIGGYLIEDALGLALLALVAGMTGGMMTMGGGVLQVAGMMVFFGYGMYLIRPVAYLTNIFVYGAAAVRNNRSGLVMWENVRALVPWAVAGVLVGYFIGNFITDGAVATLLGIFALLMGAKALHEIFADDAEEILRRVATEPLGEIPAKGDILDDLLASRGEDGGRAMTNKMVKDAALGLPMGLVSGILGISGGLVEVPLQRYFGGVALRNAIANSSVLVFWASVSGALVAFTHGISSGLIEWSAPIALALIMVPGAYVGGILGARLMTVLPVLALNWFYAVIMLAVAAKMLLIR